jgi:hypothetical protein
MTVDINSMDIIKLNLGCGDKILQGHISDAIKDFRFDGKNSAIVEWPSVLKNISIEIKGT